MSEEIERLLDKGFATPAERRVLDVWEWEHQQMIDEMMESKMVLQNYSKM